MPFEHPPPRSVLPLGWIIALSGFGLLVTIVLVVIVIGGVRRRIAHRTATSAVSGSIRLDLNERDGSVGSISVRSAETVLNASNANQVVSSGNETTLTKTFALDDGAAFSLKNTNGSITVAGWDQPSAEVKAIQVGSDNSGQVFFAADGRSVSIRTAHRNRDQEVRFEVKLPSKLSRVALNSVNGPISISNVSAGITIRSVNGAIELTMQPGFDANVEASTVRGSINIGDQYNITVQKEGMGQRASGQLGSGGQLLKLTTVNGSIKLMTDTKQRIGSGGPRLEMTPVNGSIKLPDDNTQPSTVKVKKSS